MSAQNPAVADFRSETYPKFSGKIQDTYIEGYVPSSLSAPHSSLQRTSTWLGMGLLMGTVPPAGILIWALGVMTEPAGLQSAQQHQTLLWIGIVATVIVGVVASFLIWYGRRYYRQYRAETGRRD